MVIVQADALTLGVLKPPGELGVDIAVGEGQPLGNRLDYGGPSFGFFAASETYLRRMPGRIAGETTDVDGRRGFVLTLQTREQHIRREKATHNICTAQALNALAGVVYLSWLGRRGIVELGELMLRRTAYARETLTALDGVSALHEQPVVREFAVKLDAPVDDVIERCAAEGVGPGLPLEGRRPARRDHRAALQAGHRPPRRRRCRRPPWPRSDEQVPRMNAQRDAAAARPRDDDLRAQVEGRRAFTPPPLDVPETPLDDLLPEHLRRAEPPRLPEVSEPEIVRHYTRLSTRNFDLDTGLLPARLVHDEAQPEAARAGRGAARQRRACTRCSTPRAPRARCS